MQEIDLQKRAYRHWTTLEDKKLMDLRKQGVKFRDIASQLNRTPISVEKRFRKIEKTKFNEE
ncbi:Myb-like DNA-binding domain-containing protein [Bacillus sp. V2I10]|uniref:Myb-like DNA-binding domain-containing protein n=1 Tax=Bacillus sp. V2I10 TaxID=3042276 RepID=UPI0027819B17|nr:Myb-like DNA-binding domain-containing protein [Bacillus sp. V2I10]MDQ0857243.1 IS30 family transposase [Bacillus sp. V2I10]